jgi:hypothetical protein
MISTIVGDCHGRTVLWLCADTILVLWLIQFLGEITDAVLTKVV